MKAQRLRGSAARGLGLTRWALACWLLLTSSCFATTPLTAEEERQVLRGIEHVYNLDYPQAISLFEEMIKRDPESPVGYTYLSFCLWAQELSKINELTIDRFAAPDFFTETKKYDVKVDPEDELRFLQITRKAIDLSKAILDEREDDPRALFLLGVAYGNLASYQATLKRSWYSAYRNGVKAYKSHRRLLRHNPPIYDVYRTIGVYNYVVGSLRGLTKWVAFLLGHSGDREGGKQALETAAEKGTLGRDDAKILLTLIHTREGNYEQAYKLLAELHRKYPRNYLLHIQMAGQLVLARKYDQAIQIYNQALDKANSGAPNYHLLDKTTVYNRLGDAHMHKGDHDRAIEFFQRTIKIGRDSSRTVSFALLGLGKTYDLMGRRSDAISHYKQVLARHDVGGVHEEARRYLDKPFRVGP